MYFCNQRRTLNKYSFLIFWREIRVNSKASTVDKPTIWRIHSMIVTDVFHPLSSAHITNKCDHTIWSRGHLPHTHNQCCGKEIIISCICTFPLLCSGLLLLLQFADASILNRLDMDLKGAFSKTYFFHMRQDDDFLYRICETCEVEFIKESN